VEHGRISELVLQNANDKAAIPQKNARRQWQMALNHFLTNDVRTVKVWLTEALRSYEGTA
jgi:hypothetical protein